MNNFRPNLEMDQAKEKKENIQVLWRQEEAYRGACARVKWLNYGDKNSRFFHATIVQKR